MQLKKLLLIVTVLLFCCFSIVFSGKFSKNGDGYKKRNFKNLKNQRRNTFQRRHHHHNHKTNRNLLDSGLWSSVINLATKALISSNATCGINGREEFCRLSENSNNRGGRCGICENYGTDQAKRHPINYAIDGSNRWWQSPALHYGPEYEYVTIVIDLKQIFQIDYIIIKSANAPRPGAWILERSLDDENYEPWQYFARTDKECMDRFGIVATKGKPHYLTDTDVICTSFFSRLTPMENGEIHISLIQGRPNPNETNSKFLKFTQARYVRFRLLGHRANMEPLPKWINQEDDMEKKLFYSIRDIAIGGKCICNGHAENCRHNVASGNLECDCQHHTCGPNCDRCCPLFNQMQWSSATLIDANQCLPCNCHGHADNCHFNAEINSTNSSMNIDGIYRGGGVCDNCTDHTTGINCEKCIKGFYRPIGVLANDSRPCSKCECNEIGTESDICEQYGNSAGTCKCKSNYAGSKCDICAVGFRNFPICEPCPCDSKGTINGNNGDCEGECVCKANVEGKFCDKCKSGYFGLNSTNPDGCLTCFCSGVTSLCELAVVQSKNISTLENWVITNLNISNFITPISSTTGIFAVTNYQMPGVESLYWLTPKIYLGNKLEAYGSRLSFTVQWVVMRGDTSGYPTTGPNIIITGANGLRLGYGDASYDSQRMSFDIQLTESNWYIVSNELNDIHTKWNYPIERVTRQQFLSVLMDMKYILLRAKYHTDQIETLLEHASMSYGNDANDNYDKGSVEKCACPSGYNGLSCEACAFGYVRIYSNTTNRIEESFCGKCDCNGHSETCNSDTGECFCQHNTVGEKCERCTAGYYGNPLRGTADDCKQCACPLENEANNFSPSCQLDDFNLENVGGYVCTQCPKGYTGDHCEICDDGYFGNPLELNNNCKLCDCNGGPCDRKTGQCLSCKGNTEGWKCERCKPDHYGDPAILNCKACECDPIGSVAKQCDNISGQCLCKEQFVGRKCDRCDAGYGNVTALCPPCNCNRIGSESEMCDTQTGICKCLQGVEGFRCDACQNLHWGFSNDGCKPCNCDPNGSKYSSCDPINGKCICKSHYDGKTCDKCKAGYWKNLKKDCIKCHCNEYGSRDGVCDEETGQCNCQYGVGGQNCDVCLANFYGTVDTSCIECEPCSKQGHVCGKSGKCVCPPLTIGKECDRCSTNSWGYEPGIGCKSCNCSQTGSISSQCDKISGQCFCKTGYQSERCDRCAFGYYGYPNCRKCLCNIMGTVENQCYNGTCQCNNNGSCNCKANVIGSKCNTCTNGTFGLSKENVNGCRPCFCFGRSTSCTDTGYNWDKIRYERKTVDSEPIGSDIISLPRMFTGDLTTSYDGYLSVSGTGGKFLVFLTGNYISLQSEVNTNELRLNENYWKVTSGNIKCKTLLTRECFLIVLQNVTSVIVQAENMEIMEVLLDSAKPYIPYNRTSDSIEKCDCPIEYTGLSCQNPNKGYYRYFPTTSNNNSTWIDQIIGMAKPCDCNGRSNECDTDTGYCTNCLNNTVGSQCESCVSGYYNYSNQCLPCHCPSESNNNAKSCNLNKHGFQCVCKPGYTGSKCDSCKTNYYQNPSTGKCIPCHCNNYGSFSTSCTMGVCHCKHGFEGEKCNQCVSPRQYIKTGICTDCDQCVQLLFDDIDRLNQAAAGAFQLLKGGLNPPWKVLDNLQYRYSNDRKIFKNKFEKIRNTIDIYDMNSLDSQVHNISDHLHNLSDIIESNTHKIATRTNDSIQLQGHLSDLSKKLNGVIENLQNFGKRHVDVKVALKQALSDLGKVREFLNIADNQETTNEKSINFCNAINKVAMNFYKSPTLAETLPKQSLEILNNKLNEIVFITGEINEKLAVAQVHNSENAKHMKWVKDRIDQFNNLYGKNLRNMEDIDARTRGVQETFDRLKQLQNDMLNFNFTIFNLFENQNNQYEDDNEELGKLVNQANDHVKELEQIVDTYKSLLNFTKKEWKTIEASGAYDEITKGIENAKKTVEESQAILNNAIDIIVPKTSDKLSDKTTVAHAKSDRLKHRIQNLKNLSARFNDMRKILEDFRYNFIEGGKANNEVNKILLHLENEITSQEDTVNKLHEVIANSSDISEKMRNIDKDISNWNLSVRYDLFKQYKVYLNVTSEPETQKVKNNIEKARLHLEKINQILESNSRIDDALENQSKHLNFNSITSKIKKLQNSISYAKQLAESVNIALGLTNCSMHYSMPQTEIFRSLSISFACTNCKLFEWHGINDLRMMVTIKDSRATLTLHDGENHTKIIADKIIDRRKVERTLLIQKTGALLQMKYENDATWRTAYIGNQILIVHANDDIQLGSNGKTTDDSTEDPYIYSLSLNDRNVGLWNFAATFGNCIGQKRTNTKTLEGARSFYSGTGYKMYGKDSSIYPAKYSFRFDFSTFDENSVIYLAQEIENPCSFIILTLTDGNLKLTVRHTNDKQVSLISNEKYNDGRNHFVDLVMFYQNRIQKYSLQTDKETVTRDEFLDSRDIFKIRKAHHFVGGISPKVDDDECLAVEAASERRSFLGFLDDNIPIEYDVLTSGIVKKNGTLELDKIWFNKNNGFAKFMLPKTKTNHFNITFILRPLNKNSAIMSIKPIGQITLNNKLIQLNLNNKQSYSTTESLNLNEYNLISIQFNRDSLGIAVNGKTITFDKIGLTPPDNYTVDLGHIDGYEQFYGGISDIVINGENLLFSADTLANFKNIELGREDRLISTIVTLKGLVSPPIHINLTNSMQNTERCSPINHHYKSLTNSVRFDDSFNSYIQLTAMPSFWKNDFKLEMEFRTFSSNGMLFLSFASTSQTHYNYLKIKDGIVTFMVRGKRKPGKRWPIGFSKKVNDGNWHTIKIEKIGKKIQMWLDKDAKKPVRMPKNTVENRIYFGGVSNDYDTGLKGLGEKITPFNGCFKNLKINDESKLSEKHANDIKYYNTGKCFPEIEEGAYFSGTAYAIYKENFHINKLLEFSFDFRTTEQNGIFIAISNDNSGNGYATLSVELQNGAVVMTVDLGNGIVSNVTNNLDSDFALCNNMWHKVTAIYSSSELTVNVDGIRKIWVQSDISHLLDEIDAPLYIGGLPDSSAISTIRTRENFKGCMKNIRIENTEKEWTEMERLHNILLNSCPVVH